MAVLHLLPTVPAACCPGRARPVPLRPTRRGRVVMRLVAGLGFSLAVTVAVLGVGRTASAGSQSHPVPVSYRLVLPGETLLEIAAEVDPRADVRDTAVRIARLNDLRGWGLQAGQWLAVPVGA